MLETAFRPFLNCLQPDSRLKLDVIGFASETWKSPGKFNEKELNLELAEGRRAAVIDFLNTLLEDSNKKGEIVINPAQSRQAEFIREPSGPNKPGRRFSNPDEMQKFLRNWVADDDYVHFGGQIKELLERSAVVRVVELSGSACVEGDAVKDPNTDTIESALHTIQN